ncbi:MAG: histidine phosphatase family protein [Actinomycetaceae bacterium]|nr:histidine phosphatase family protein [Actinomycetaceae bacterium]
MRLVLVRHGQTPSNIIRALDTAKPGADLDEVGRAQVADMAENFVGNVGAPPTHIVVSPLARTRQTAAPLEEKFGIRATVAEGIRELIAGDLEMMNTRDAVQTYLDTAMAWVRGDLDVTMPGGEDGWQTRARFGSVISHVCSQAWEECGDDAVVALVAHGALCRVIATALSEDISVGLVATYPMHNASTTVLEWKGGDRPWIGSEKNWTALTWGGEPIDAYDPATMSDDPIVSGLRAEPEA